MRGWMLAGLRRGPGPLIGTVIASATAATLATAALGVVTADTHAPAGRLAHASVVVAADTGLTRHSGSTDSADTQTLPLTAYRGLPATMAQRLAQIPGVATAIGESGFPNGLVPPGDVDVISVTARPGVSPGLLALRIKAALHGGHGYTIATGTARGDLADLSAGLQRSEGQGLSAALIPPIIMVALFVLAATSALAVNLRRGRYALLRAVGATRGQVRRAVLTELALCGLAGGALGWLPGTALAVTGVRALAAHQMLPAGSATRPNPWLLLAAAGIGALVAAISGLFAARRAARTAPAQALRETLAERKWPHPVRVLLGAAAAGGSGTLMVVTLSQKSPAGQLALAFPLLLAFMVTVALLGPLLVAFVATLSRPALATAGPSARLALAAICAQPRRAASAVIPVAMAVAMIGTVYFAGTSISRATSRQAASTVTADHVIEGAGLTTATLRHIHAMPGVLAAAGVAPVTLAADDPDLEQVYGEAVAGGPIGQVLSLGVASGSLTELRPGQIAVSALEAASGAMGVHTGSRVTVYLPDGTPYHATVCAIYSRSLAAGDVLIPAVVAAGHTGTAGAFQQILVNGGTAAELAAAQPGIHAQARSVANAQAEQAATQNGFANNMILGIIASLAAVALVNTLVVATRERRRALRLLARTGATRGQAAAVFGWHVLFVAVTGIAAGAAVGTATLLTVTRAATGSWTPYIPFLPAAGLITAVIVLTGASVLIPFWLMSRPERGTQM
ncbi:MAG TPA: FtsX-like permease family protein [Streptosporangiaceae bacterium]|nr:FtsX-like permease family protein [Streptosporangiaceae bacterium]